MKCFMKHIYYNKNPNIWLRGDTPIPKKGERKKKRKKTPTQNKTIKCFINEFQGSCRSGTSERHILEANAIKAAFPISAVAIWATFKRHATEDLRLCE